MPVARRVGCGRSRYCVGEGSGSMCMNCGCMLPDEDHGDSANIVLDDLRRAGTAMNQTLEETVGNIATTWEYVKENGLDEAPGPPRRA